jgi:hypothetical protein
MYTVANSRGGGVHHVKLCTLQGGNMAPKPVFNLFKLLTFGDEDFSIHTFCECHVLGKNIKEGK